MSFISGVEVVTVLFLVFAFVFGVKMSVTVGTAFSLLRCLVFGFSPNVLILYLLFYNFFAVVIGVLGNKLEHKVTLKIQVLLVILALFLTLLFTMLDNLITPLYYGLNKESTLSYVIASLTACIPQLICNAVTVGLLFYPLYKVCYRFKA